MNINMKYYIVTIGSIFLALGIGIIVGFNLNYDQELTKQQGELIEEFDGKFDSLNEEKKDLNNQLESLENNYKDLEGFIRENYTSLVTNALTDKNIGIILTNEKNDYSSQITDMIDLAKGNIAFNIVIKDDINNTDKLEQLSEITGEKINNEEDCINYIFDTLDTTKAKEKLDKLQELDLIEVKSLNEDYELYDSAVLIGEDEDEKMSESFEIKDKNIISKLKSQKKYLVAVQREESKSEFIELCSKLKISTIDNINDEIGEISLSRLLKEKSRVGDFGVGKDVESLIPFSK